MLNKVRIALICTLFSSLSACDSSDKRLSMCKSDSAKADVINIIVSHLPGSASLFRKQLEASPQGSPYQPDINDSASAAKMHTVWLVVQEHTEREFPRLFNVTGIIEKGRAGDNSINCEISYAMKSDEDFKTSRPEVNSSLDSAAQFFSKFLAAAHLKGVSGNPAIGYKGVIEYTVDAKTGRASIKDANDYSYAALFQSFIAGNLRSLQESGVMTRDEQDPGNANAAYEEPEI